MNILMISAENDGLKGGKVGGAGDVVRDVPPNLAKIDCNVKVVIPSYGFLHNLPGSKEIKTINYNFAGKNEEAKIYEVTGKAPHEGVTQFVIDNPKFISLDEHGNFEIFHRNTNRPFATDASRFAHFCIAVAEAIKKEVFEKLDCIHLHDWHTAFILILRHYHPDYQFLQSIRTAYTIHNLEYQGVRPFDGDESSLNEWYPEIKDKYDRNKLAERSCQMLWK
jgi:starch synthase